MSTPPEPSPLATLDAAIGVFDIYQFIRPAFRALKDCIQDEVDVESAYGALQSQVYFMSRFLCFAEIVGSEYLIPDDIHSFRQLHANLAKLLSPDQLVALRCEDWVIDNPGRQPLPLDYEFPPAQAGSLPFTPQRQKLAEEFMVKQHEERAKRIAARKASEKRERRERKASAKRERRAQQAIERAEAARQAELQRQADLTRESETDRQAALEFAQSGFQSLIPLSDRDFAQSNPSPPRAESSKTAGKRKCSSSARQSARQLAKSKATISSTDDDEDAQLPSAGPSKKAKYAPSRPHTKILSQEAFLEDARSLWQQTPAGLRANEPPPLIDAAQLKVFHRGFKAQVKAPCFACVMGDTEQHCKFLGFNKGCPPCTHHKRGRCSFVWSPEERAYYREHAYSLGQNSLTSFQEDLRDIQFHCSQGLISARQAESSYGQADRLAGRFTQRVIDLYHEDFPATLTRSVFTSQQCVDFVLERASNVDAAELGHHGLPLIDELLLFLDPNVFERVPTTSWEHTVLQYRLYRESQEQEETSIADSAAIDDLLDLEAEEAPSDEGSDEESGEGSPRPSNDANDADEDESVSGRSDTEA
ncbi:hypothetical protein BDZ97DRAFT_1926589 [Flammula alnicola]|nr:hypothetical protein BDZ97DRAFT_1926589 [Flammula alnicola]